MKVVFWKINHSWNGDFWVENVEQFNLTKNKNFPSKFTLNARQIG